MLFQWSRRWERSITMSFWRLRESRLLSKRFILRGWMSLSLFPHLLLSIGRVQLWWSGINHILYWTGMGRYILSWSVHVVCKLIFTCDRLFVWIGLHHLRDHWRQMKWVITYAEISRAILFGSIFLLGNPWFHVPTAQCNFCSHRMKLKRTIRLTVPLRR